MTDAEILNVPLGLGLDETNEDAFVPATAARVSQNVVFADSNTAQKRPGIVQCASLMYGRRLVSHDREILAIDGLKAYAYQPSQNSFSSAIGPVSPCMLSRTLLGSGNNASQSSSTAAVPAVPMGSVVEDAGTGLRVYVWTDCNAVLASVYDVASGTFVQKSATLQSSTGASSLVYESVRPRVVLFGGYAFAIYQNGGILKYRALLLSNPNAGWTAEATIPGIAGGGIQMRMGGNDAFDACAATANTGGAFGAVLALALATTLTATPSCILYTYSQSAGVLTMIAQVTVEAVAVTAFTTVTIAPTPPSEQGANLNQVAIAYGYFTNTGGYVTGSNAYALRFAVYNPRLTIAAVQLFAPASMFNGTDNLNTATAGPTMPRAVGLVRNGVGSGVGSLGAQWLFTFSVDYRVTASAAGGTTAIDHRYIPALYYGVAYPALNGALVIQGPILGYQPQSKPFAVTINAATQFYVMSMFQDGIRAGVGTLGWSNGVPSPQVQNGSQTLVLLGLRGTTGGNQAWLQPTPCAVAAPRFAGDPYASNSDVAISSVGIGASIIGTEKDVAGSTSISSVYADFQHTSLWQSVRLGDWTWIGGGLPMMYDGNALVEAGFVNPPIAPCVGLPAAGASVIPKTTALQYYLVYVQQDAAGNVHRSKPVPSPVVNASAGYPLAYLNIAPLSVTLRQFATTTPNQIAPNPVRVEVYRNNTGAGLTVWQLIASVPNDPSAGSALYFVDQVPDAAGVTTAPILYTTGGSVPSEGPPNLSALAVHADRIFGISEDGRTAYFTTSLVRSEAPRFTDAFTISWPDGPITAQWSLEQRLHVATADQISYIFGEGPNDTGAGSDFTSPSIWQDHLGAIDAFGVLLFEGGAVVSTKKGVYLEDRSGSWSWIGQKFRRTAAASPFVSCMCALDSDGTIKIGMASAPLGGSGTVVHVDYRHSKIATHVYSANYVPAGMVVVNGSLYLLLPNSITMTLYREDATTHLDAGIWVPLRVVSGWVKVAGDQGSARVHRVMPLAVATTPHQLTVSTARDYSASFDADAATFSDATISTLSAEQLRHTPTQQKCMAMSVAVSDSAPATLPVGIGAGPNLQSVMLRVRSRRGEWKRTQVSQQR